MRCCVGVRTHLVMATSLATKPQTPPPMMTPIGTLTHGECITRRMSAGYTVMIVPFEEKYCRGASVRVLQRPCFEAWSDGSGGTSGQLSGACSAGLTHLFTATVFKFIVNVGWSGAVP